MAVAHVSIREAKCQLLYFAVTVQLLCMIVYYIKVPCGDSSTMSSDEVHRCTVHQCTPCSIVLHATLVIVYLLCTAVNLQGISDNHHSCSAFRCISSPLTANLRVERESTCFGFALDITIRNSLQYIMPSCLCITSVLYRANSLCFMYDKILMSPSCWSFNAVSYKDKVC